ncbi:LacI family DNA-binding transcriptional regulator [Paenibacillus jilunlii]|uniref:LacI family transcriptional regulator n=1 Tax=Paenibacillus jilunlii TaxID=682956 RepID=A0A1G9SDZ4_9BACL|nr:LacI family DNA-binding transcriptional regulator [Paenibacillus jilunlii]KWX75393.1 LacI family transcriptional regulator [Paenibacillus jilunlii]SDM33560.1 transcriptional regulator, LacI family [Paenibacillus jilunlii]
MANIKEIARIAGVSVTTVSRVLNNHPYVSKDKRTAVLETIEQLNYTRNMNAVHLITGRTGAVAVILPFINSFYFSVVMDGLAQAALAAQYRLILCQTNYVPEEELKVLDMLRNKEIDGVIIVSTALNPEVIEPYTIYGPVVTCQNSGERQFSSVYIEHYAAFRHGLEYLYSKGHRRIGYCEGRQNGSSASIRQNAFQDFLAEKGLPFDPEWMIFDCIREEDGAEVARRLLDKPDRSGRPEAMMISGDHVAAGLIIEARKHGLKIPEDLAVMGFDNQPIGRLLGITTIDNQLHQMGEAAFGIIHEHINGSSLPVTRKLEYRIIERSTV